MRAGQAEEGRRRVRYATVLRVRPDHVFLRRMPPVDAAGWLGVPLVAGRVLLWDDQISLARREEAAAMLLAPTLGYGTCADEAEWVRATRAGGRPGVSADWSMDRCQEVGDVPCSAMALALVGFGAVSSWRELPLKSKDWLPHPPGEVRPPDDFCLKRPSLTSEAPGRNGRNPDELGMAC